MKKLIVVLLVLTLVLVVAAVAKEGGAVVPPVPHRLGTPDPDGRLSRKKRWDSHPQSNDRLFGFRSRMSSLDSSLVPTVFPGYIRTGKAVPTILGGRFRLSRGPRLIDRQGYRPVAGHRPRNC